jgi:hypothetical protein
MIDPRAALILLALGLVVYGGDVAARGIGHGVKKAAVAISHPFRHPKKDAKAVATAVTHPAILKH